MIRTFRARRHLTEAINGLVDDLANGVATHTGARERTRLICELLTLLGL